MTHQVTEHRFDTVVVGGGQAGLAMGYWLARLHREFVVLDAGSRVGDNWRHRWDSLRLFTPSFHNGLPGLPFPAPGGYFPTKDELADYLETYARTFDLPVRLRQRVEALSRHDDGYLVSVGDERYLAKHVVVATGPYHHPSIPAFAAELNPSIAQLHSSAYRNPGQLPAGDILVVGAGNSGAEIAVELAATRRTYLAGRDTGHVPIRLVHNHLSLWLASHLVTVDTRLGRKAREAHRAGDPLVRLSARKIAAAGVERVPRVEGIADGKPRLADGRPLDVAAVLWATGFRPDFRWIDLPIFDAAGNPIHHRGIVDAAPGLSFLGLPFQHSPISTHVGGVGKDARYLADHLAARTTATRRQSAHARTSQPNKAMA
jgi:putative flavoprotein involved in K+ transport